MAETGDGIAGTVSFYADASLEGLRLPAEYSGFRALAVDPRARGRGVARMLVPECIERARVLNSAGVAVHTALFMQAACRIYEEMGFHRWPEHDRRASEILDVHASMGEVMVIAYRLKFTGLRPACPGPARPGPLSRSGCSPESRAAPSARRRRARRSSRRAR